jgi:hypothetical protein
MIVKGVMIVRKSKDHNYEFVETGGYNGVKEKTVNLQIINCRVWGVRMNE